MVLLTAVRIVRSQAALACTMARFFDLEICCHVFTTSAREASSPVLGPPAASLATASETDGCSCGPATTVTQRRLRSVHQLRLANERQHATGWNTG